MSGTAVVFRLSAHRDDFHESLFSLGLVGSFHEPRQPAWSSWFRRPSRSATGVVQSRASFQMACDFDQARRRLASRTTVCGRPGHFFKGPVGSCKGAPRRFPASPDGPSSLEKDTYLERAVSLALRTGACDQLWRLIDPWTLLETLPGSLSRVSPSSSLLPHPFSLSSWFIILPLQSLRTVRCEVRLRVPGAIIEGDTHFPGCSGYAVFHTAGFTLSSSTWR